MSEHELWNELGNLYFLNGAHDQAIMAYNNAIQLESSFGNPYSNLALIYTKQKKYNYAVTLYRRSLELLTDDFQKAVTWNRLGNVYRQLKDYQEAVVAFKSADELRTALEQNDKQADQIPDIASESDLPAYELVEDQRDYQYQAVEYLFKMEPEFDETLPAPVLVEAEIAVDKNQHTQHAHEQAENSNTAQSEPEIQTENSEEKWTEKNLRNDIADEKLSIDSDIEFSTPPVEQDISDIDKNESEFVVGKSVGLPDAHVLDGNQEIISEETVPKSSEAGVSLKDDPPESRYEEPIAQAQENVEASAIDLPQNIPQTENAMCEIGSNGDVEIPNSIVPAEDEIDTSVGNISGKNLQNPTVDESQQTRSDELDRANKEIIGIEEKKLAKQIEINPRSATTWEALGTLYKTAARYEEAIQAFEQAISIAPREVSYYHNLGLVYAAQGNNQEAFNTFQKVLELDPNHSLTHASLGGYYKKMGLDELAQKHIGKAIKHIYESENEYNRACLDAICGNIDQAIELLRIALENEQTYVDWVVNDPDLEPLHEDERFKQLIADFSN